MVDRLCNTRIPYLCSNVVWNRKARGRLKCFARLNRSVYAGRVFREGRWRGVINLVENRSGYVVYGSPKPRGTVDHKARRSANDWITGVRTSGRINTSLRFLVFPWKKK